MTTIISPAAARLKLVNTEHTLRHAYLLLVPHLNLQAVDGSRHDHLTDSELRHAITRWFWYLITALTRDKIVGKLSAHELTFVENAMAAAVP